MLEETTPGDTVVFEKVNVRGKAMLLFDHT